MDGGGRTAEELRGLSIGTGTPARPEAYDPGLLEAFANRRPGRDAWTSLVCPEFTCLCPKTGQPDFARITVNYVARERMVESRSMKLYLLSFRNHGCFHEDAVQVVADDLAGLLSPRYLEVVGEFNPRGGVSIVARASRDDGGARWRALAEARFQAHAPDSRGR